MSRCVNKFEMNRRRVAVVGPVTPFRGGVAKHTTHVARALAERDDAEVRVISFRRLYPKWLFPGEDDRDPDGSAPDDLDIEFALDTLDPLSWGRAARAIARWKADTVVMPAWTFFTAPCLGCIARACRRAGAQIVMIVHNVDDHEAAWWKRRASRFQLHQADRYITHGDAMAAALRDRYPGRPVAVRAHPPFDDYPEPEGRLPRRAGLELLFFGLVRPYKGVDILVEALARSGLGDVRLSIVGEFWEGREAITAQIDRLGLPDRIEVVDRYVSDKEAAEYFARADVVVLPYRSATGTGVIPLAYRYGKPVIVSDLPGLTEVVREGETGWIVPAGDVDALANVMRTIGSRDGLEDRSSTIGRECSKSGWGAFAALVEGSVEVGLDR